MFEMNRIHSNLWQSWDTKQINFIFTYMSCQVTVIYKWALIVNFYSQRLIHHSLIIKSKQGKTSKKYEREDIFYAFHMWMYKTIVKKWRKHARKVMETYKILFQLFVHVFKRKNVVTRWPMPGLRNTYVLRVYNNLIGHLAEWTPFIALWWGHPILLTSIEGDESNNEKTLTPNNLRNCLQPMIKLYPFANVILNSCLIAHFHVTAMLARWRWATLCLILDNIVIVESFHSKVILLLFLIIFKIEGQKANAKWIKNQGVNAFWLPTITNPEVQVWKFKHPHVYIIIYYHQWWMTNLSILPCTQPPPLQLGGPLLRTKAMPLPTSN